MKEEKKWIILSSSDFISLGSTFEAYGFRLSAGKAYGSSFNVTNWMFSAGNDLPRRGSIYESVALGAYFNAPVAWKFILILLHKIEDSVSPNADIELKRVMQTHGHKTEHIRGLIPSRH
ncbi:hypothetical protein WN943_026632 [Citrus x changshan-huyou]